MWSDDKDNAKRLLSSAVYACLEETVSQKLNSIAFPPVGVGRLFEYPVEVVAETMISTIKDFLKSCPHNSLTSIVIIDSFLDTAKHFQNEMQTGADVYYGKKGKEIEALMPKRYSILFRALVLTRPNTK